VLPTLIPTWSESWGKAGSLYGLRPLSFNPVKWLIERDLDYGDMPKNFSFARHSMNTVGAENRRLMSNYLKRRQRRSK
jgi:hypothetical protein